MTPVLELADAILAAKARIAEHLKVRPDPYDIPARTGWAWDHHDLTLHLEMLECQDRVGWDPLAFQMDPHYEYHPAPVEDAVLTHLAALLERLLEQTQKVGGATSRQEFERMRQAAYWMRAEVVKYAIHHRLRKPPLPILPQTPWTHSRKLNTLRGATGSSGAKVAPTRM